LPGIIIGASSQKQLQENLEYLEKGPLPDDIVEACEKAWSVMAGARPLYYHGEYKYKYDTIEALYGEGAL
jgi:aflatoxin B1 aldehyde reductase